jgi:hypothetical protein
MAKDNVFKFRAVKWGDPERKLKMIPDAVPDEMTPLYFVLLAVASVSWRSRQSTSCCFDCWFSRRRPFAQMHIGSCSQRKRERLQWRGWVPLEPSSPGGMGNAHDRDPNLRRLIAG